MFDNTLKQRLHTQLQEVEDLGLYKHERIITSPQDAKIRLDNGETVLNLCSNNYLGLANHPKVVAAASESLKAHGFGMSSVRFICGTQDIHKELEHVISNFLQTEDTILYSSCFDANGGLFETLLSEEDAVISDALNHASIIDGIRLCKAKRYRYANNDMNELEQQLKQAKDARVRLIVTDGVFSMDGIIADLPNICALAEKYHALVMVDDSHAVGFMGDNGKGTPEFHGVMDKVDIITGTLGKALGGASGGYTSGRKEIIDWLRQRSRPYLFSNSLAPMIVATSISIFNLLNESHHLINKLKNNTQYFYQAMHKAGFKLQGGQHPIIPVMLGDARLAADMANALLKEHIYVIGFSFPVVPQGQARIRTQMSAALDETQLLSAVNAFNKVGNNLGVIS